ncbi:hypothetical protein GCM10011400_33430 [Paraburkholderia caffeinilytica]|uniref:Secreted protein n=1 Tax=Paraburkholderia caffeinilytica TaxID=1761016 RepID=A0ABQ1MNJ8_9BURK|nr:hypothetical protein GCM10011400_33430 [Paraburkholderia caffeinilytica]
MALLLGWANVTVSFAPMSKLVQLIASRLPFCWTTVFVPPVEFAVALMVPVPAVICPPAGAHRVGGQIADNPAAASASAIVFRLG